MTSAGDVTRWQPGSAVLAPEKRSRRVGLGSRKAARACVGMQTGGVEDHLVTGSLAVTKRRRMASTTTSGKNRAWRRSGRGPFGPRAHQELEEEVGEAGRARGSTNRTPATTCQSWGRHPIPVDSERPGTWDLTRT